MKQSPNPADGQNHQEKANPEFAPLANWEQHFADIHVDDAQRARWERAVRQADRQPERSLSPGAILRLLWNQLILPARRAWVGLAMVWACIILANMGLQDSKQDSMTASHPTTDWLAAMREQQRAMAELLDGRQPVMAEPPKPSMPRSQTRNSIKWV